MKEILSYGKWTIHKMTDWSDKTRRWLATHDDGRQTDLGSELNERAFTRLDEESTAFHVCRNRPAGSEHPCMFVGVALEDGLRLERMRCVFCGREHPLP